MIGTIILGYFTCSLRLGRYSELDHAIISTFKTPNRHTQGGCNADGMFALEKFILALSDQQLVTGISLTVAIYLIRYGVSGMDSQISGYSYGIAVNLALLSWLIHLSSINVLRDYLGNHKTSRNVRVFLMLLGISMLLPELLRTQSFAAWETLRCALAAQEEAGMPLSWAPWRGTRFQDNNLEFQDNTVFCSTLAIIVVIARGYIRTLLGLYLPRRRQGPDVLVAECCATIFGYPTTLDLRKFAIKSKESHLSRMSQLTSCRGGIRALGLATRVVLFELSHSFIMDILWLLFYFAFGLCQITEFMNFGWLPQQGQRPVSLTPDFGQVLPLVMLGMPLFTAVEAYAGLCWHITTNPHGG